MSPDLNSLPQSRPWSEATAGVALADRPRRISLNRADNFRPSPPSPRSPSLSSLQAAATINAGLHRTPPSGSPNGMQRRRSSLLNNLSINDPALPALGEIQHRNGSNSRSPRLGRRSFHDPHIRDRQLSLGELHQELENEQEAQVNRLLYMIRLQQDQLAALTRDQVDNASSPTDVAPALSPVSTSGLNERPSPRASTTAQSAQLGHFHRPHSLSRQSSSRLSTASSRGASPALPPATGSLGPLTEDFLLGGTRDESAFYQAETQMLTRENQMLKHRIRELERQISDLTGGHTTAQSPLASTASTADGAKD